MIYQIVMYQLKNKTTNFLMKERTMSSTGSREAKARIELDKAEKGFVQIKKFRLNFQKLNEFAKNLQILQK